MSQIPEVDLTLSAAARLARVTQQTLRVWLTRGDPPPEIRPPAPGQIWHLPSTALVRHLRKVRPYLADRLADGLERAADHWARRRERARLDAEYLSSMHTENTRD